VFRSRAHSQHQPDRLLLRRLGVVHYQGVGRSQGQQDHNSSALEDIYDHAQEAIDWTGESQLDCAGRLLRPRSQPIDWTCVMLGEKALAVDLHHQPFIRFDTPFGYLLPRPSL